MLARRHGDKREGGLARAVAKILVDETPWECRWGFQVEGVGTRGCPGGRGAVEEGTLRHRQGVPDHGALLPPWALVEGCAGELRLEGVPLRRRSGP